MKNNLALSSLAMDLKRVALGLHNKSYTLAERFYAEALKRKKEIELSTVAPYLQKILQQLETQKITPDQDENILMYSILIQNYVIKNR